MSNDTAIASLKEKIDTLNQQAWEARVNDSPKSFELSQESVKLSRSINYTKGLAEGLRSLGFCYIRLSKNDEAEPLLRDSLALFQSLNDLRGQAVVYESLGIIERNWGNLGRSLELLLKGIELVRQVGLVEVEITSCYQIGVTYKHLGNHDNALDYLYRALSLSKEMNLTLMEAYAINIIGSIYFDSGDYQHALDCYQQGLVIRKQSNDKWGEAGSLDNIGFTYLKLKEVEKAIDFCRQSLAISQSTGDKKGEANALLHLAEIYKQANDVKKAFEFSNESLEIRKARGDRRGEAEVLLFLADLQKDRNDISEDQLFEWISGALAIAGEIKAQDILSKAYYNLHEHYSRKGNYKESLTQLEAHLQIEKELHKNTINQKISNLEISHKAEAISQRNKELTELNEQIEKANAELRIESSLERVRTAAMAMKVSSDMLEVCKIISQELAALNVKEIRNVQTAIFYEEKSAYMNYEYYPKHDKLLVTEVEYNNHPVAEKFANQMLKGANQVWTHAFKGQQVQDWLKYQRSTNVFIDTFLETAESLNYYWYSLGPVALGISTYLPLPEDEINLFKRFRNVFELAYRRYNDIEKAQAQAREAQIEAALEKIRSRSLAMHNSDELQEVVHTLFEKLKELNIDFYTAIIILFTEESKDVVWWLESTANVQYQKISIPFGEIAYLRDVSNARRNGIDLFSKCYSFEEKNALFAHLFENTALKDVPEKQKQFLREAEFATISVALAKNTGIHITSYSKKSFSEEDNEVFKRFTKVFDQAYTRFLDLQKAEAQAREAQIETALEKVRSRSLAMHQSSELEEVIMVVSEQLQHLQFRFHNVSFVRYNEQKGLNFWLASPGRQQPFLLEVPYLDNPVFNRPLEAFKNGVDFIADVLTPEENHEWLKHLIAHSGTKIFSEEDKKNLLNTTSYARSLVLMKHIILVIGNFAAIPYTEEQNLVLKRFANVFDQAYTRFLDLQKAEAQAREAQIEAALERVRAKVMAMTNSTDLDVTSLVFGEQLRKLGIDWQFSYFWLIEEDENKNTFWITWPDNKTSITVYTLEEAEQNFNECLLSWRAGIKVHENYVAAPDVQPWLDTFQRIAIDAGGVAKQIMTFKTFSNGVYYYDAMMRYGSFGICINKPASDEEKNIQCRFAIEFERAYTRFLDLKKAEAHAEQARLDLIQIQHEKKRAEEALAELQATQKQLIQSEKMASLGELTAGIAHEIQNPLNFVNNFSDVSNELIEEMKEELATGNTQQAMEIANDVKDNLEKILHHGQRADAIVKGMLQHSRSSTGIKEPTDINNLADEYLRLAFHGFRAKDKSFNAKFETNFDSSIERINVIPQDIGRVILNLINNAFYTVNEKAKQNLNGYEPKVTVSTKKIEDKIEIKVEDNGNGIPQKVLDKIFQPFFTTKPTGQGTGLGLSLSYDIITKGHAGDITVNTSEGKGAEFIVSLPVN